MNISRGFHQRFPTDIGDEISLARELYQAARVRWGLFKSPRMFRTDPAALFRLMQYARLSSYEESSWHFALGIPMQDHTKPTNAEILTPSHPEWIEFQERLEAELVCPDFEEFYGASQTVFHDSIETEYWPLCSAQLIASLGFAVAESLVVMANFLGRTDETIAKHVESLWRSTKPSKVRPAFDAVPLPHRTDAATGDTTPADQHNAS